MKDATGNIAYYTDGVKNYSIADVAKMIDTPVDVVTKVGKHSIKMHHLS